MALPLRTGGSPFAQRRTVATPLTVVPGRRRMAWFAVGLTMLVGVVLTGALLLHTLLAERQLQIDALERSVREERQQFDVLRAQRAELRSPTRLAVSAGALGMSPGLESQFISVDPMVLAITIARTGEVPAGDDDLAGDARLRPLDQFRIVKSLSAEAP
jgi:heme exporter protein D